MKNMKWLPCTALVLLAGLVCASCASTPDEGTGLTNQQARYRQEALSIVEECPGGIIVAKEGAYAVEAFIPMRAGDIEIPYDWATDKIRGDERYSITGAPDYYIATNFDGSKLRIYNPNKAAFDAFRKVVFTRMPSLFSQEDINIKAYKLLCNMMSEMCGLSPVYYEDGVPLRSIEIEYSANNPFVGSSQGEEYAHPTADGFRMMTDELFQSIPEGWSSVVDDARKEGMKLRDIENPYTSLYVVRNVPNGTAQEEK